MNDLDQADMAARVVLCGQLRDLRKAAGLSGESVARSAGFGNLGAVRTLERQTSWLAPKAQRWARGLDHVLRLQITGLTVADDTPDSLVLKWTTTFGGTDEDHMHLLVIANDLVRTRLAAGISRVEMAERCGVTEGAIRDWEDAPAVSLLRLFQRYGRALGGAIHLDVQPVLIGVRA